MPMRSGVMCIDLHNLVHFPRAFFFLNHHLHSNYVYKSDLPRDQCLSIQTAIKHVYLCVCVCVIRGYVESQIWNKNRGEANYYTFLSLVITHLRLPCELVQIKENIFHAVLSNSCGPSATLTDSAAPGAPSPVVAVDFGNTLCFSFITQTLCTKEFIILF